MVLGVGKNLKSDNYLKIFIPVMLSHPYNFNNNFSGISCPYKAEEGPVGVCPEPCYPG